MPLHAIVQEAINDVGASGAAQTLPAPTSASMNRITLSANCTFTFPAATAGWSFLLVLDQDATGGRTATWPAAVKWPGAAAPLLSTGASKRDVLSFACVDGSTWMGFVAAQDVR